jgi:hypothetical protein
VPTAGNGGWNGFGGCVKCSDEVRLYCLCKDANYALQVQKAVGRVAFLSSGPWRPGGGLPAADAHCQAEARAVGFAGVFKALLSTSRASAASRFGAAPTSRPWVRPDGIPLVQKASDLFAADGRTASAFQVTPMPEYVRGDPVWTGGIDPQAAGTAATTCADWTAGAGTGDAGAPQFTSIAALFGDFAGSDCADEARLYCLEE